MAHGRLCLSSLLFCSVHLAVAAVIAEGPYFEETGREVSKASARSLRKLIYLVNSNIYPDRYNQLSVLLFQGKNKVKTFNIVIGMKSHLKKVLGSKPNYDVRPYGVRRIDQSQPIKIRTWLRGLGE